MPDAMTKQETLNIPVPLYKRIKAFATRHKEASVHDLEIKLLEGAMLAVEQQEQRDAIASKLIVTPDQIAPNKILVMER